MSSQRRFSYLVVVNPVSGAGNASRRAHELLRSLSGSAETNLVETTSQGDASQIARDHADEVDRIIAVGGDGTLNEILTGLLASGRTAQDLPEVGLLPAGTGNAAVRAFGLCREPAAVAKSLREGGSVSLDVGVVTQPAAPNRAFLLWLGAALGLSAARGCHLASRPCRRAR